jgi:hypothetical protein
MACRPLAIDHPAMISYAVLWQNGDGEFQVGKIELDPYGFALTGMSGRDESRRPVVDRVEFENIWTARLGREVRDRIVGQPALILERAAGGPLRIASIDNPGTLRELAERLAKLIPVRLAL